MIKEQYTALAFLLPMLAIGLGLLIPMLWITWKTGGWGPRRAFCEGDWPGDLFEDAIRQGMSRREARDHVKRVLRTSRYY